MKYQPTLQDEIIICRSHALYEFDQQVVVKLYYPLFNNPGTGNFYSSLNNVFAYGSNETPIMTHQELLRKLNCNSLARYLEMREELEAVGLIRTYFKKIGSSSQYIIALRRIISPEKFFYDPCLSELLKAKVTKETYEELQMQFLVHNFDLSTYENVSVAFDECYSVDPEEHDSKVWWINLDDTLPKVKNQHFDLNILKYMLADQKGLTEQTKNSKAFEQNINRMAFMFNLSDQEMADAILDATTEGVIDYDVVRKNCVKKGEQSEKRLVINKQSIKSENSDKLIATLEKLSPAQVVAGKFGTKLLPSEIGMFDELQAKTGVSLGILNVLIIYVITNTNGQIPTINYFRKVLNTWIRSGVKTTEDAMKQLDTTSTKQKTVSEKPDWYKDYLKDLADKDKQQAKNDDPSESLEELERIFD